MGMVSSWVIQCISNELQLKSSGKGIKHIQLKYVLIYDTLREKKVLCLNQNSTKGAYFLS